MSPPTYERRALSLKNFPLLNPRNNISPDAKIGEHVNLNEHRRFGEGVKPITIEPGCVVGASTNIKENVTLHANVHIGMNTEIGKNVDIGTGTKIARHVKIMESVHIGREAEIDYPSLFREHAWIGDNVVIRGFEIGVGVRIGDGVRVMSDVGDGTKVGKGTLIIYNATIGRNVVIGENVRVNEDTEIGDRAEIANNVYLLKGVKVGADAIITEGKIVAYDIAARGLL